MSFPDSINVATVFVQEKPDFSKTVTVISDYRTSLYISRRGEVQAARRRQRPRYSFNFMLSALDLAAFTLRRANSLIEMQSPIVTPVWTHPYSLSSMTTVDNSEFLIPLARKKFKVGSYAYFTQAGKVSTFRLIIAVNSTSLTFDSVAAYPTGAIPSFTAGAQVYPCILGRRTDDSTTFSLSRVLQTDETIAVEEL